jgi:immunoglobulin-binding protein 1
MIRKRTEQKPADLDLSNNYDLIASLVPSSSSRASKTEEDLDSQTDEMLRETTLLVLRLLYAHSSAQLQSMEQELELLRNAPPSPTMGPEDQATAQDPRDRKRKEEENDWKLDKPALGGPDGKGPLMDAYGKVSVCAL